MPKLIYCTYLTVYTGNKLPPFYIGSTSVDKINKGYRGSVASKNYKSIWKQELYDHPDLFKTIILTRHETREAALDKELIFHESFTVARNPMYINMVHANGKFFTSGPLSPEHIAKVSAGMTGKKKSPEHIAKLKGQTRTPESKAKMSAAQTGRKHSLEAVAKQSAAQTGKKRGPHSSETKTKIAAAKTGKKLTPEHKAKIAAANTGKKKSPRSPEHIAKRVAARLENILRKKNFLLLDE